MKEKHGMTRFFASQRIWGGVAAFALAAAMVPSIAGADELADQVPGELAEEVAAQIMEQTDDDLLLAGQNANEGDELLTCLSVPMPASFSLLHVSALPDSDGYFTDGDTSYVTSVKNQVPWGTCWAFASIAASETSILSSRGIAVGDGDPINLSEKHLAWFAYTHLDDDDESGQGGEGTYCLDDLIEYRYNHGGGSRVSIGAIASGSGPVDEGLDPSFAYSDAPADSDEWRIDSSLRFNADYQLNEGNELPCPNQVDLETKQYVYDENATAAIQSELMRGRAVQVSFCADTSSPSQEEVEARYINTETWAHYCFEPVGVNHEVTIVGWDDSYSKENFLTEAAVVDEEGKVVRDDEGAIVKEAVDQPPYDGAWIVKNSWGSDDWGEDGYFYLSYYDQSLRDPETYEYAQASETEDFKNRRIDQYDFVEKSWLYKIDDLDEGVSVSNIFTAKVDETLTAVSCETATPGTTVTYEVYRLDPDYEDPDDGMLLGSFTETYEYAGYHRLNLADEGCSGFAIPEGTSYSVVVSQVSGTGEVTMKMPVSSNEQYAQESGDTFWDKSVINEGESFISYDGAWLDWSLFADEVSMRLDEDEREFFDFDNPEVKGYATLGINEDADLAEAAIGLSETSFAYTGKARKPVVTVTSSAGVVLEEGVDYVVSYSDNTKVGTAQVSVTGTGSYVGSQIATFKITQASQKVTVSKTSASKSLAAAKSGTYKNKLAKTWTVNTKSGYKFSAKTTLSFSKNKVYVYSASKKKYVATSTTGKYGKYFTVSKAGSVSVKKGLPKGTYALYIKGTAAKTTNYKAASKTVKLVVKVK